MSKDGAIVLHGMGGSKVWTRGHKGVATGFTLISSRNSSWVVGSIGSAVEVGMCSLSECTGAMVKGRALSDHSARWLGGCGG